MQEDSNKCNDMNVLHLFAAISSIIVMMFLSIMINIKSVFMPGSVDSFGLVPLAHWFLIFVLVFLGIYSLYFFRSLTRILIVCFSRKYFWIFLLIISLIITNIIYLLTHPLEVSRENIIYSIQIYIYINYFKYIRILFFIYCMWCPPPIERLYFNILWTFIFHFSNNCNLFLL